jgi:hypothetical protein
MIGFWEEIIVYCPLIQHEPHKKRKDFGWTGAHRQQDVLISLLKKKLRGDTQMDRHRRIHRRMERHGYTDRQTRHLGDIISVLLSLEVREIG